MCVCMTRMRMMISTGLNETKIPPLFFFFFLFLRIPWPNSRFVNKTKSSWIDLCTSYDDSNTQENKQQAHVEMVLDLFQSSLLIYFCIVGASQRGRIIPTALHLVSYIGDAWEAIERKRRRGGENKSRAERVEEMRIPQAPGQSPNVRQMTPHPCKKQNSSRSD